MQSISPEALAKLFALVADQVECVLLNACYSEIQAKAIVQHIPFVIGMNRAIGDKAAIAFSVGFYKALGANRSIEQDHISRVSRDRVPVNSAQTFDINRIYLIRVG